MSLTIRSYFALLFVLLFVLANTTSKAQNDHSDIDSLKVLISQTRSDTQKVNLLIELTSRLQCIDSLNKLEYALQAVTISEKNEWSNGMIRANLSLGNVYFVCMGNYAKALSLYAKTDTLAKNAKDKAGQIIALNYIALVRQKNGQYKEAINHYRQVLALDPGVDEEVGALGNLGVEYNNIGDYNQALSCYYRSLKIVDSLLSVKKNRESKDTIQMACLLLNIGDVYMEMTQPDKAFSNYDSVYKIGKAIKYPKLEIIGLMGMGEVFLTKKNYEKAIAYYQIALKNCTEPDDINNQVKILNKLANAYLGTRDLIKAMEFAQSSLKLAQEKANNEQLPKAYVTLGKVYLQQKQYTSAAGYLQQALGISQKTGAMDDERDAWLALDSTYKHMDQPAKALDAYEHYITLRDKVYNIDKLNEFTRQQMDFDYKSRQQAERLTYNQKIARQQLVSYAIFAGLVLVVLLAFFIFRNYNTQRKYNELLSREKQRHLAHIEAQDTVLTDIAHIQSHHVRGPVATILGLTQIFNYDDPTDPLNAEVMKGLAITTEKLDTVVKEVILKENRHKAEQDRRSPTT